MVQGFRFRVQGIGLGFRVYGLGFRVWGCCRFPHEAANEAIGFRV